MNIPLEERPRERLLEYGVNALKVSELLAIILGSGTKGSSATAIGEQLLMRFGSLEALVDASIPELIQIKGIGRTKAIELKAAFGLAKKLLNSSSAEKKSINSSREAFEALAELFFQEKQEILVILLLDPKLRPIHKEVIGRGTLTEVLLHPREVFAPALHQRAHKLILAHNHPSGDLMPSQDDIKWTRLLKTTGEILGIALADHLIFAGTAYYSFRDNNLL